ncbi:MAG: ABC transporter permease [Eubacterium sp.]|nr:ABC transporter permease [Eubacterium sp.]
MFFELVSRNSKRSRRENGLFFASLLISIIAFYIILSLSQQDVMFFLRKMESDAVNRLLGMIPLFYGLTLIILFFLVYFASKFQLERRRHEFGMYLMLGIRRYKLFVMLLAEDLRNSLISLIIGLPVAVLLSELISLITARLVGLGIIGHRFSLSLPAVLWTAVGFLIIKLAAFLILSGKISKQEIGTLLQETSEPSGKQKPAAVYALELFTGVFCLCIVHCLAISGISWRSIPNMALTLALGFLGILLFFHGLCFILGRIAKSGNPRQKLFVFNFRQLEENVIRQPSSMAVSSLLIMIALCCFGSGVAISHSYSQSEPHVLDYTFEEYAPDPGDSRLIAGNIRSTLKKHRLDAEFSTLFDMKIGHIRTTDRENAFVMTSVMDALDKLPESEARDILLNNLYYESSPHLIALSSYNELLRQAGLPELKLESGEAAVYMDSERSPKDRIQIMDDILSSKPETQLDGRPLRLTEPVQTTKLVTDRSITLLFALILPDEAFSYYTQEEYDVYVNGILKKDGEKGTNLMSAISEMNEKLDAAGLDYESYLQNMGRQLFYIVAASYITIYLAVIFLIIANTITGVQFLMSQQKTNRRYKTLIRLGAGYKTLCRSAGKQINWYFGIPSIVAVINGLFGIQALFSGLLPSRTQGDFSELLFVSSAMLLILCVIEYVYITAVKRSSSRYLLTLMAPEREE